MTRFAVIINGDTREDTKAKHLLNVDRALAALGHATETFVVSPSKPHVATDHYFKPTPDTIRDLVDKLEEKITSNDELVIYTTGHGQESGFCLSKDCNTGGLISRLNELQRFSRRVVVMDQCLGGSFSKQFTSDPRTLFISVGSRDECVRCDEFSPLFWSARDTNGDGVVSWQERYAVAKQGVTKSSPQYLAGTLFVDDKPPPFSGRVVQAKGRTGVDRELAKLKSGQYAAVVYSAPWCGYCKTFKRDFAAMATKDSGQHLFLWIEDKDPTQTFGVNGVPTVVIVDGMGKKTEVWERDRLLEKFPPSSSISRILALCKGLASGDADTRYTAAIAFGKEAKGFSPEDAAVGARELRGEFGAKNIEISLNTSRAYCQIVDRMDAEWALEEAKALSKMLEATSSQVRFAAIRPYGCILGRLSPKDALEGVKILRRMFGDEDPDVRQASMRAYAELVSKLNVEESLEGAKALRGKFGDRRAAVRLAAMRAYMVLADKLNAGELLEGTRALQGMYGDEANYVRQFAVTLHDRLASRPIPK